MELIVYLPRLNLVLIKAHNIIQHKFNFKDGSYSSAQDHTLNKWLSRTTIQSGSGCNTDNSVIIS